jgi:tRNA(His) 5'-end guanylyltransferase
MDLDQFRASLKAKSPPRGAGDLLAALWHEARGNWDLAHRTVQALRGKKAAAVHAYLHRREGNLENADYWYKRAGVERSRGALDKEWAALAAELLEEE